MKLASFPLGVVHHDDLISLCGRVERWRSHCVDLVLMDLPYGTTANKWDAVIPFEPMWDALRGICKPDAAVVLTAQCPFDKTLSVSNLRELMYEWIFEKVLASGFLNAGRQPLRAHETVLVFSAGTPIYNPQKTRGSPYKARNGRPSSNNGDRGQVVTVNDGVRHPRSILFDLFPDERTIKVHPTQKHPRLFEYLIKTYTNEGAIVFDGTCGSGTTAVAARNLNRRFIVGDSSPFWAQETVERLNAPDDKTWAKACRERKKALAKPATGGIESQDAEEEAL